MNRLWRRWRPRSVRARLVATYTVVAVVLAAGGIVVFSELLHKGLDASLDATLQTRLAPLVNSVQAPDAGGLAEAGPTAPDSNQALGPASASDDHGGGPAIDSFSVIYRPDGRIAQIEPTAPRFAPLTADQIARARNGPEQFKTTIGDDQLRVWAAPVIRSDGTWVAAVGSNGDAVTDAADRATHELLLAVPFLILAAAVGAWLLSGAALRPVERLRSDAARLGAHDPKSRLRVPDTADELARLAETFNGLLDRLQRSVARQRDLVADAGHELRTPLAVLRTELDLADGPRRSRADLADSITHARSEVDRLCQLAEDLLFLARADENAALIVPVPADLREVVNEATRAARASADLGSVHLISDVDEALTRPGRPLRSAAGDRQPVGQRGEGHPLRWDRHGVGPPRTSTPRSSPWPTPARASPSRSSPTPSNASADRTTPAPQSLAGQGSVWPSWPRSPGPTTARSLRPTSPKVAPSSPCAFPTGLRPISSCRSARRPRISTRQSNVDQCRMIAWHHPRACPNPAMTGAREPCTRLALSGLRTLHCRVCDTQLPGHAGADPSGGSGLSSLRPRRRRRRRPPRR